MPAETDSAPGSVDFHFDPMCPFAYRTSIWIRHVRNETGLDVRWRFFSLEEINRAEGKKHPWERDWSYGWSLMRIGALLRRRDAADLAGHGDGRGRFPGERLDHWYSAIGAMLHERGGKPHDPAIARALLGVLGEPADTFDAALADPTTHDEVRADHDRVVAAGGFGVPTLFFPDGQALFGPVLIDPPEGEAAVRLWRLVEGWREFPHLFELQRPKSAADSAAIAASLTQYVQGRDWVSINRGEVIDLSAVPGAPGT